MTWSIDNKNVIVTGGTSGIGRATAIELAKLGANVTITSRTFANAEQIAADIGKEAGIPVGAETLDLSSLTSVREFANRYISAHDRLDVLINNAGNLSGSKRTTSDGLDWTMAANHFGPFLLTNLLRELLTASAPSRIINVSSENHRGAKSGLNFDDLQMTGGYTSSKAYAASKLAGIMFTAELDRRLGDHGIIARALHPGVVATNFGKQPGSPKWLGIAMKLLKPFLSTPEKGAATSVYLATAQPDELEGGLYWSKLKPKEPIPPAVDKDAARRLWDQSAELVGLAT